ncbi:MAG: hypothetical protein ACR2QF_12210, partial [Geminicoccaceae bacterium]
MDYLTPDQADAEDVTPALEDIVSKYGPPVEGYPCWHPFVQNRDGMSTTSDPKLEGLDHTIYFRNAFVTCPYTDGQAVLDSVVRMSCDYPCYGLSAERLDVKFYSTHVTSILVT